jgi:hypothetical protein
MPTGREIPYGSGRDLVVVTTDDEGRFLFSHLAPGKWTLQSPYDYVRARLEVRAGTKEVRFVVQRRR